MKKSNIILILFPLISLALLWHFTHPGLQRPDVLVNKSQKPLEFADNTLQCPQCHMYLVGKKDTAQIITSDYKTHFFDDVGCAILWLRDQNIEPKNVIFWIYSRDTTEYILAQVAYYSISDDTPMEYGFAAYKKPQKDFLDFEQMRLKMLRGETLHNPKIRKNLRG